MKKLISFACIFTVLLLVSSFGSKVTQKQVLYEVKIGSRVLGELSVIKQEMGDREDYLITQLTEDGLLHKSKVEYRMHSEYRSSKLVALEMRNIIDGVVLQSSDLVLNNGMYQLKTDIGSIRLPEQDIMIGSAFLFFEEPNGWSEVFHEKYGRNMSLKQTAEHVYEIELPNGGREVFTYTDGRVSMITVDKTFGMFIMSLKNQQAKG